MKIQNYKIIKLLMAVMIMALMLSSTSPISHAAETAIRCDCTCNRAPPAEGPLPEGFEPVEILSPVVAPNPEAAELECNALCTAHFGADDIAIAEVDNCIEFGGDTHPETPSAAAIPKLVNPLGEGTTVPALLGRIINAILGIVGSIALLMFVYGGFMWLTSGGAEDKIKKGKETLVWASLGLVIIFSAYALLNFVLTRALGIL